MTKRLTDEELAHLERLEQEAMPGPWGWVDGLCGCGIELNGEPAGQKEQCLLVAARNDLPSLLAEVRELRSQLQVERDKVAHFRDMLLRSQRETDLVREALAECQRAMTTYRGR